MQTEQDLIDFLTGRAEARWQDGQPYYLSLIATELKERGDDYKPIIGDERLKLFVRRVAEQGGFKVIEHPTQRAKVAIVPAKAEFSFSDEEP